MRILYNSFIKIVSKALPVLGHMNKSIMSFVDGRNTQVYPTGIKSPIWIHCASLGEFEQGRPIIDAIKKQWPHQTIILTFFSKSGYQVRKEYPLADWVGYMPLDTPQNAATFVEAIRPRLAIFVKYEFWFNHLDQLAKKNIPFVFISVNLFKGHYLLKSQYKWLLDKALLASAIFVQDEPSQAILTHLKYDHALVTGDTRIDRVLDVVKFASPLPYFHLVDSSIPILVAGSTWPEDELILKDFFNTLQGYRMIIAPHDPSPKSIAFLTKLYHAFTPVIHSQWQGAAFQVMIIDSIGLLNKLYAYAQVAYVGGGFGKGIHNILEPAAYGIPVFIGPKYHAFKEAEDLSKLGVVLPIHSVAALKTSWSSHIPFKQLEIKNRSIQYFAEKKGATAKIIDYLRAFIG